MQCFSPSRSLCQAWERLRCRLKCHTRWWRAFFIWKWCLDPFIGVKLRAVDSHLVRGEGCIHYILFCPVLLISLNYNKYVRLSASCHCLVFVLFVWFIWHAVFEVYMLCSSVACFAQFGHFEYWAGGEMAGHGTLWLPLENRCPWQYQLCQRCW